ncbi:GDP-mannose 4,6-dehydratase [Patescibacteria group bacterium]|nr:GDP-mannose 4,6-dehydratase [Patescibacteria group bacterium]
MRGKTVLITGSAGFIGTNLTSRLLDEGSRVVGLDSFVTGKRRNVNLFKKRKGYTFFKHDIRQSLPDLPKVDLVYNLACPASPPSYQSQSWLTLETAVLGLKNVLEWAKKREVLVVQSSTSEVYGEPLVHPQKETYWGNVNPVGPRSCYDEGKRAGETLCFEHVRLGGKATVVRIFNTYGPFMDPFDGRVVTNFITQALNNQPLTIYGKGEQTRSFCYIDDLVEGLIRVGWHEKEFFGPVNMGNPNEITILSLARKVLKLVPETQSRLVFKPLPKDDPTRRCPNSSLAKKEFGWEPAVTLEDGLKETISYLKKRQGGKR